MHLLGIMDTFFYLSNAYANKLKICNGGKLADPFPPQASFQMMIVYPVASYLIQWSNEMNG